DQQHDEDNEFHGFLSLNVKGQPTVEDELALVVGLGAGQCQARHSSNQGQLEHCWPGDGMKSRRSSPSTYPSMSVNSRDCCWSLMGGSGVITSLGFLVLTR